MKISPELWQQLNPLLTDAMEMEAGAREEWLDSLEQTHAALTPALRKMLAAHDRAERSQEMETVPRLAKAPPPSSGFAMGSRVGPFALLRLLGRGGMGEVWLANQVDGRVEREVALKLPTVYLHSEVWRERFRRERDILAKLAHPNIARLFDAGVSDEQVSRGQPYLAMEFIEGESLTDYVAARKSTIEERLKLFRQILAAVAHAHRHLVVHRDLKPANILIDKSGQVKLLDFGIAKLIDDGTESDAGTDLTQIGGRVMTLRYAAPEQVSDSVISTATDTYALGVILHELVTGLSPYGAVRESSAFTQALLLGNEPSVPSTLSMSSDSAIERNCASAKILSRQIAGDLDAIILKAMRRNPADRYASIEQFDNDIERHLDSRPVAARAGTWRYLATRFVARYKFPVAATAAVLLTMMIGVVLVERERRVAVAEKARAEKHFASVRKLANSFMFEVHSEIENLEGSLKAREMLVKTSLQYLDGLANEVGNEPALTAELASAYRKIASIQGELGRANLGMMSSALENYEKSKQLFVALGDYKADDIVLQREHMSLRYSLAKAYARNGDSRWQENFSACTRLGERIASMQDASPGDRRKVAGLLAEEAHLTNALIGASPKSDVLIERALSILEAQLREMPTDTLVRATLAFVYQRAAVNFALNAPTPQRLARAIEMGEKSLASFAALSREFPTDPSYPIYIAEIQIGLAVNLAEAGRYVDAEREIELALKLLLARQAADRKNEGLRSNIVNAISHAVNIAYRQGALEKAIRRGREGLAQYAQATLDMQKIFDIRNAVAAMKSDMGFALMSLAGRPGIATNRRVDTLREACALLADSVAFGDELRAAKFPTRDEVSMTKTSDGLSHCRGQLAKSG